MIITSPV